MSYSTDQTVTTEDAEVAQEVQAEDENSSYYPEKAQQDDYFDADISIAGREAGEDDDNADF